MNTKTFAQLSRTLLMEGVANRLLYWGFESNGTIIEEPQAVEGGYIFRGKIFDDETVPKLWNSLKNSIQHRGIEAVKEEAAYTWFNRVMALQIMAKNDYLEPQLSYVTGMANTPHILQKARQGQFSFLNSKERERLGRIITDFSKEQEAFALLLVGYCHSNKMLNTVFGRLDDFTELLLPDNMLQDTGFLHLLNTTDAISDDQYKEVELIGWLYQFYISERKDEVFASFKKKKKAEAKDIPAATQIFTPNWIVKYMVQNTVGKIWLDKNPSSKIKSGLKYLVENESDITAEPIISEVSELTLIDPAVGSGHILVEGFDLLYQMYMEEYYTPEEAVESILKNNLFGLDLDERAAQLANFAILLKAAKQYRDVFAKGWLPNVHAMPESAIFSGEEIKDFLGTDGILFEKELTGALRIMAQAKNLGSIMKLSLSQYAWTFIDTRFTELKNTNFRDINTEIVFQKIKSFIPVLLILSKKYTSVVANPPYMGSGNMNADLKNYVTENYPLSKADLYTVFMEICGSMISANSYFAMINQHNWMFLTTFSNLRSHLIEKYSIKSMLHLGTRTFSELGGEVVQSVAFVFSNSTKSNSVFYRLVNFTDITEKEKAFLKRQNEFYNSQNKFKHIEGDIFAYWLSDKMYDIFSSNKTVSNYYDVKVGLQTGDNDRFRRNWQEVAFNLINVKWFPYNSGGPSRRWYGNQFYVVNWLNDGKQIKDHNGSVVRNSSFYFKESASWSSVSSSDFALRYYPKGFLFDNVGSSIFEKSIYELKDVMLFLNSKVANEIFKALSPTLKFEVGQVSSVPLKMHDFNISWEDFISICKNDWDSREISWDFRSSPLLNDCLTMRSSYKKWFESVSTDFFQLLIKEEELNRVCIELFDLQDELSPEVALKDITILQDELKKNNLETLEDKFRVKGKDAIELPINRGEVISQFISYAVGLFMGRYRLDKHGLNIAHPNPSKEELASYTYNHGAVYIDQDAILPLMGKNCNFNDDIVKQFTQLLDTIWGHEQRTENINFIQECLDKDLEKFIVNDFWKYHCDMYKKTPIYWLFSSKKGAFQVLVYMHRMNEFTVEKIRANYLLEHLKFLKSEIAQRESNITNLSTAEARQLDKLRADLTECEQYDLALKNVADQQIKFDLDDGVSKNYELFEGVVAKIK